MDLNQLNKRFATVDSIRTHRLTRTGIRLDLLRLDQLHEQISGNKWFKMKHPIKQAQAENCTLVLSFGGA